MPRSLRVDMDALLDAIAHHGDEATPYLDTVAGAVEYSTEFDEQLGSEEDGQQGPWWEDPRWVEVPRRETHRAFQAMERFATSLDDVDVQQRLGIALGGHTGGFRRFRDELSRHADLWHRWQVQERDELLASALAWLTALDIAPIYALRPLPPPPPTPAAVAPRAGITLTDLLLLGAPGNGEVVDGRVRREYVAADAGRARATFTSLARELTEQAGIGWRKRFVEGRDMYEIGRHVLAVDGVVVRLLVQVPRPVRDAFRRS